MVKIKLYQVDAFSDQLFSGNPAAVCPLEKWLPDEIMQAIAMENNLAETAFVNLDESEDGISPGQACVFYNLDQKGYKVLGGGWIVN